MELKIGNKYKHKNCNNPHKFFIIKEVHVPLNLVTIFVVNEGYTVTYKTSYFKEVFEPYLYDIPLYKAVNK